MSNRFEYIAVALLESARERNGGISLPKSDLTRVLIEDWNTSASDLEMANALRLLNRCDISYSEDDEFAGVFVTISESRFAGFLAKVEADRRRYDDIIEAADNEHDGLNAAEALDYRYLDIYNRYAVIRKYHAFGSDWLRRAMSNLPPSVSTVRLEDAIQRIDQESAAVAEIREKAAELKKRIRTGNKLGQIDAEQATAIAQEIEAIEGAFAAPYVRSSEIASRSRRTLGWVGEKAAGTLVGETAKALLKLILAFLGIQN
jgi:hypothetical protein